MRAAQVGQSLQPSFRSKLAVCAAHMAGRPTPPRASASEQGLTQRFRFFDAVVISVACFALGHRAIFQADIRQYNVAFRKFLRRIVGPPAGIDWNMPWHQILHQWNVKALHHWEALSRPTWGEVCLRSHWHFAMHVASLPRGRWIKRALEWRPMGRFAPGRPRTTWTTCLEKFASFKRWCDWATAASQGQMLHQARTMNSSTFE